MNILDYINRMNEIYGKQEPRITAQAPIAEDLEPGSLRDEMLKGFDPSQETHEEYLQRINLERPFNAAHGGRIGFFEAGLVKQGPNTGKASIPDFNEGKTAYFKDLETAKKAIELRKEKTSKFQKARKILNNPQLKNKFIKFANKPGVSAKDVMKEFNISSTELYDSGLRKIIPKDFQAQAHKLLKTKTIDNMLLLHNHKKAKDFIRKGLIIPDEIIEKLGLNYSEAATATVRLGQHYGGHDFGIESLNKIRRNTVASDKLFTALDKFQFGNPYHSKLYRISLETIDSQLGNERGTFDSLKNKARYILKKNKIKGFDINEIAGVTGTAKSGVGEFSQFIDIMDRNLNQKQMASFQSAFSQARQNIKNNPKSFAVESKKINKLASRFENEYGVKLPRIRNAADVEKYYSTKRLAELKAQGLDIKKASKELGYTVQMPKKAVTIQEFVDDPGKLFSRLYASKEGRKQLKTMTSLTGINNYLRANGMDPICVTRSPKKCGMDLIKSEGGVDAYRSELEKRVSNAKGDEKWFKAYNNPKLASVKNFFKGAGRKLWKIGKAGVIGELYYIPFGTAYETGRGKNLLEALDNSVGLGGHFGMEEKNLMKYADTAGYSEEDKNFFSQFAQLEKNDNWTTFWEMAAAGDKWATEKIGKYYPGVPLWSLQEHAAGKVKDLQTESENIVGELYTGLGEEGIFGKYGERQHLKDVQAIDWINKAKEKEANVIINKALAEKHGEPSLAPHTPAPDRWLVMENLIDAFTQEDWLKKVKEEGLKKEKAGPLWSMLTSPVGAFYAASKDPRVDREKILEEAGREDLLYKEYMHPLYGASFSYPQAVGVGRFAGGGMVGIRKPSAIAPTGGPMSQGLRSLYINDKDY